MSAGLWMFYVFKMMSDKGNVEKKVCLKSRKCEKVAQLILFFFIIVHFSG